MAPLIYDMMEFSTKKKIHLMNKKSLNRKVLEERISLDECQQ
jgi:hypothetical protein